MINAVILNIFEAMTSILKPHACVNMVVYFEERKQVPGCGENCHRRLLFTNPFSSSSHCLGEYRRELFLLPVSHY